MELSEISDIVRKLNEPQQRLLCYFALGGVPCSPFHPRYARWCALMGIKDTSKCTAELKVLFRYDLFQKTKRREESLLLQPQYILPVIKHFLELHPDWLSEMIVSPVTSWVTVEGMFGTLLNRLFWADVLDRTNIVGELLETLASKSRPIASARQEVLEMIALHRYYAFGLYEPLGTGTTLFDCILRGVRSLHKRDYAEAQLLLKKALSLRNKQDEVKNVFRNPLTCFFLIALYVKTDDTTHLGQFLRKMEKLYHVECFWPAETLAVLHFEEGYEVDKSLVDGMRHEGKSPSSAIMRFFANFFEALDNEGQLQNGIVAPLPNHAVLRHEFSTLLPLDSDERDNLMELFGQPVYLPEPPQPKWKQMLDDVKKTVTETPEEAQNAKKERIAYVLSGRSYIEPRLQGRLKSGAWSAGKALPSYASTILDCMDETDRRIYQLCRGNYYALTAPMALPLLVGSDRVLLGPYAPLAPVTVEEEKPHLLLERVGNHFKLSSNVPEGQYQEAVIVKKSNTHYSVIRLTHQQHTLYQSLLRIGDLPLEAEEDLRQLLPVLKGQIEVHSPVFEEAGAMEKVEGSSRVTVRLRPAGGQNYFMELFCHPLPGGTEYLQPGKGAAHIIDKRDDVLCKVHRDLKGEKANLDALLQFCASELVAPKSASDCKLPRHEVLLLLDFTLQHPDGYEVEWPEGERMRLLGSPAASAWDVTLRKAGRWFEVEGDVQVDENHCMTIAQLLRLYEGSNARFVKIGEDEYLRLSDAVRRQLEQLSAISDADAGKLHVSPLHANLLAEAVNGGFNIAGSTALAPLREKISQSFKLRPNTPRGLKATLRDYQLEGFRWMVRLDSWGAGACLADDMGLGKTVQTIALLLYKAKQGPSLVVAPTSVVTNWQRELERFAPSLRPVLLNELDSEARRAAAVEAVANDVVLTTYGVMSGEIETLAKVEWNVVCLDEAHTIKNRNTQMAQAATQLQAATRIALTGTPLQNHVSEVWSLFHFLNPGMLGTYEAFNRKFGNAEDGLSQQHLQRMLTPFILRRTKGEVIAELPEKTDIVRDVELTSEELAAYETFRLRAKKQLEEEQKVSVTVLAEITRLRQAACAVSLVAPELGLASSKIDQLLELVEEIMQGDGHVLVFSQFTSFLALVRERLEREGHQPLYLDGSTPMRERERLVQRFQAGERRIFIISLKAGGLGLNLTRANYVIHLDPWWNPAIEQQATDRSHRIGQRQAVTVYHLISRHTIEEKIVRLHKTKRDLADSLLEGTARSSRLTEQELLQLLSGGTD